jgi:hypothetical protein
VVVVKRVVVNRVVVVVEVVVNVVVRVVVVIDLKSLYENLTLASNQLS